jgi:hypothetical protein
LKYEEDTHLRIDFETAADTTGTAIFFQHKEEERLRIVAVTAEAARLQQQHYQRLWIETEVADTARFPQEGKEYLRIEPKWRKLLVVHNNNRRIDFATRVKRRRLQD